MRFAGAPPRLIPGIGPKTAERLAAMASNDRPPRSRPEETLAERFGARTGRYLRARARFQDDTPVATERIAAESRETTFDPTSPTALEQVAVLRRLAARALRRTRQARAGRGRTIAIKVRLDDWTTVTARPHARGAHERHRGGPDVAWSCSRVRAAAARAAARRARRRVRGGRAPRTTRRSHARRSSDLGPIAPGGAGRRGSTMRGMTDTRTASQIITDEVTLVARRRGRRSASRGEWRLHGSAAHARSGTLARRPTSSRLRLRPSASVAGALRRRARIT